MASTQTNPTERESMKQGRARIVPILTTVLCATAVAATSASAAQFTASAQKTAFPLKLKGLGVGAQMFKFGKIELECASVLAKGTIAEADAPLLKLYADFKECKVPVAIWGERVSTSAHVEVEFLYHTNGLVQTGFGLSELAPQPSLEIGSASVNFSVSNTGGCKVEWPAQNVPLKPSPTETYTSAVYSNEAIPETNLKAFPTGFQQRLDITSELKGMLFTIEEKGLCSEFVNVEKNNGRYNGKLQVEAQSGNIGFE